MSPFASVALLATDGSREAEHAARMAGELSRTLGSELHPAYVEPMPDPVAWPEAAILNPEDKAQIRERAEEDARKRLGREVERIRGMGGEVTEAHARSDRSDAEIVSLAEEIAAGLVVVGRRGLGPLGAPSWAASPSRWCATPTALSSCSEARSATKVRPGGRNKV